MPKTIYVCEYCHKQFTTREAAQVCEARHQADINHPAYANRLTLEAIIRMDESPCLFCQRPYYVYGSEWNCDCQKHCIDYSHFIYKI